MLLRLHDRVLRRSGLGPDGRFAPAWWLWRRLWDVVVQRRGGDLVRFENRRFSQHGEDGLIAECLRRLGCSTPGVAVEIGAGDGSENCTRALVEDGWHAYWLEGDAGRCDAARGVAGVTVIESPVDADNVEILLDAAGVPATFDVLVVDIDGNDHSVLDRVLGQYSPALVVAEYNGSLGWPSRWVQPYDPTRVWDGTAWHGMGLSALTLLARDNGYVLVGCDASGTNAFLVPVEFAERFVAAGPWRHFVPPSCRLPFGHPWRVHDDPSPSLSDWDIELVPARTEMHLAFGSERWLRVRVVNRGERELSGLGASHPVHVAIAWGSEAPTRVAQTWRAAGRGRAVVRVPVRPPPNSGEHVLRLYAVQEGVRWFGGWPPQPLATVAVTVAR